jgi:hypothetical protein
MKTITTLIVLALLSGCTALNGEVCRANGHQFIAPEGCAKAADFGLTGPNTPVATKL